ncbi:MAG TPA: right-handed parallel beta-helix repeat-containing protein [Isosphaeraceae bacterium]|jgi:hypothetical protein|nr:right-handed parallel beta-helix repeat-containing protein [Isosphaeraceae bacterium]
MTLRRCEDGPARRRRLGEASRAAERLEARELMATMAPASATVKADGRVVELVFTAPMPAAYGVPDFMPGQLAGVAAKLSNGTPLENIGNVVTTVPASGTTSAQLVWTADYLIDNPAQVVTFGQGQAPLTPNGGRLSVVAGGGLLQDGRGNTTAAVSIPVVNDSLVDANGFTTRSFQRGAGGVTVYVSSTYGNDHETLAQAEDVQTPFRTIAQALNALFAAGQDGKGAAVELLRGDIFTGGAQLRTGGQDPAHPFVMESYWYNYTGKGTDPGTRPVFQISEAGTYSNNWLITSGSGSSPAAINYVVLRDLEIRGVGWNGTNNDGEALCFLRGGTGLTLDDDVFSDFGSDLVIQGTGGGPFSDVTLLRCAVLDTQGQGLYVENTTNLLISQSVFDHDGRINADFTGRSIYTHDVYIQYDNGPATVWGNVLTNAGSHGIQMRSGGVLAYNYFSGDAYAAIVGAPGGSQYKNVVEQLADISPSQPRGIGLGTTAKFATSNAQAIDFNFILNSLGHQPQSIQLDQVGANGIHAGLVAHNTVVGGGPLILGSTVSTPADGSIQVADNVFDVGAAPYFEGPAYSSWAFYASDHNVLNSSLTTASTAYLGQYTTLATWEKGTGGTEVHSLMIRPTYVNPTADAGSYFASRGGTDSVAAFLAALRGRGLGAWGSLFDVRNLYQYFAAMYTPTNLPAAGAGGFGYFGASPYQRGMLYAVTTDPASGPFPVPVAIPLPPPPPSTPPPPPPPTVAAPAGGGGGSASSRGQAGA